MIMSLIRLPLDAYVIAINRLIVHCLVFGLKIVAFILLVVLKTFQSAATIHQSRHDLSWRCLQLPPDDHQISAFYSGIDH